MANLNDYFHKSLFVRGLDHPFSNTIAPSLDLSHLTEEQYRLLLRSGKDIIWSYDGDGAGLEATKKAIDMLRYKANQWVIKIPQGVDPGSCEIKELQRLYEQRERVL